MKLLHYIFLITSFLILIVSCKSKKQSSSSIQNENSEVNATKGVVITDVIEGLNLGNKAPDFTQNNTQGKPLSLSSFKGKIVLIDFWASWCGPCRRENPNVVNTYNKFNKSVFKNATGFEVLSVSLDQNKEAWLKAIEKDGLIWPNHVSDLRSWDNEVAKKYNVNSIPNNFLVDANGIIIAKGLIDDDLPKKIESLLK